MITFFFEKKHPFFINLSKFPNFEIFPDSLTKNINIRAQMTILRNMTTYYAFYSKFTTFSDIEKKISRHSFKKPSFFLRKKTNFERLGKSYYFRYVLRQICLNSVKTWRNVKAIGKNRFKIVLFERMIFVPFYQLGVKY